MSEKRANEGRGGAWRRRVAAACCAGAFCLLAAGCGDGGDMNTLIPDAIRKLSGDAPVDVAGRLFDVQNADARRSSIAYLEAKPWGHNPPYMRAYKELTTDPEPMVRGQAYIALGSSHDPAVADDLIRGLADKNADVRRDAAVAMANVHSDKFIKPLTDHLAETGEENPAVRMNSAKALRAYSGREVVRALISALNDRDLAVVQYAWESLRGITGQPYGQDPKDWLQWFQATQAKG